MSLLKESKFELSDTSFVHKNDQVQQTCQKLYLDSRTADVHFVFDLDSDHPEKVPAHKNILSIRSPVFDTMFYGSLPEKDDIPIVDASAAAFKVFLQHFYMDQVQLTSKHIVEVMNLCKKYEVTDGLAACEASMEKSLSYDDICWGYAVALHLELEHLTEYCEDIIENHYDEVLKTQSILDCDKNLFTKILSKMCKEIFGPGIYIVVAYMEWAKAECLRNNLDVNSQNLRTQLGDLYDQIPFDRLDSEEFHLFVATYRGFFSIEELESLIEKQIPYRKANPFNRMYLPICDRQLNDDDSNGEVTKFSNMTTSFISNKPVLLKEFHVNLKDVSRLASHYAYQIHSQDKKLIFKGDAWILGRSAILKCILRKAIYIEANEKYKIEVKIEDEDDFYIKKQLKDEVLLENDVKVTFEGDFISCLVFEKEQKWSIPKIIF
ncbi:BTB/POZ domain-containing protein 6-A-like [Sitodiplosis mosellana]|uniref:BTB/POZ domain-containing protein 6-A-like n=1 Tax=Sitodiplosis mosellana TaxID=263140 RepID=UPI002443D569|nr:BTB/POZ domain-containing protein 6-A-like [Sitodiplosis mosellana]